MVEDLERDGPEETSRTQDTFRVIANGVRLFDSRFNLEVSVINAGKRFTASGTRNGKCSAEERFRFAEERCLLGRFRRCTATSHR